ncbi:MAG: hypothetical protein PHD81_01760 [Candidatus Nanoarchaeia archaeon]|nr:hypothetical protein [Candidatus Nanoarchaeia archaeon]MDD5587815.1 hypothetical protein [Candidatus Nanoarchaeia archaeon]
MANKPEPLESLEDLDLLIPGDVVIAIVRSDWNSKETREEGKAVYHKKTPNGEFQFLIPKARRSTEFIQTYQARKDQITIEDGKIMFYGADCSTGHFRPHDFWYESLNKTLEKAGLR